MPGVFAVDARLDAVGGIGAAVEVLGEQLLPLGVLQKILQEEAELLARDGGVVVPPDLVRRGLVAHHELVLGRAARVDARIGQDRAALGQLRFPTGQRLLVQRRRFEVPVDALEIAKAELVGAMRAVEYAEVLHGTWSFPDAPRPDRRGARSLSSNLDGQDAMPFYVRGLGSGCCAPPLKSARPS